MPLESLLELVRTLRARIDRHGGALRQSEALTRYALIDPLLRELGWDTSDPGMVIPEYRSGSGRADYALMIAGNPEIMVEAKSLGTPLQDAVLSQGINYCLMEGTSYFSVTNGSLWEIYETHKPVPIDDKRIVRFDIRDDPVQACPSALALWRPGVESGQVSVGQTPVIQPIQPHLPSNQSDPDQSPVRRPTEPRRRLSLPPNQSDPDLPLRKRWLPLSEFNPAIGSPKPIEIIFPNNKIAQIGTWKSVITEVARWLVNNNLLGSRHCPIQFSKRYVANTDPVHPSGKSFSAPVQIGSIFIETHLPGPAAIKNTHYIIQHVGQDPSQFRVRLP